MADKKILILLFFGLATFFTLWFAIPFSLSRAEDARMARAFITDEADLCEIIIKSVNDNQDLNFNVYGFIYYKSGIKILRVLKNYVEIDEHVILVFFRLYSWLFFLGTVLILTLLLYQFVGFYGALASLILTYLATPVMLQYATMLHPDVAQVFFIVLSLWLLYLFVSNSKIYYILLSSVAAGFAFSAKYSGVLLLPGIFLTIFFVKTKTSSNFWGRYLKDSLSVILLIITFYLFDADDISKHLHVDLLKNELLVYIKLIRYASLILSLFIVGASFCPIKIKERFRTNYFLNILFLLIASSWLFLLAYLLTVSNLWANYEFLSGFLGVTGFHSTGHNFIDEGGVFNWLKVFLQSDVLGPVLFTFFLLSKGVTGFNLYKEKRKNKFVLLIFILFLALFLGIVLFRVKSTWAHFLLPSFPVIILVLSIAFQVAVKSLNKKLRYFFVFVFLLLVAERGYTTVDYCISKMNEEQNSVALKAGSWLLENASFASHISANNYSYIPKTFKNVDFNWGNDMEELYNESIDYILTHSNVLDDFADSSLAEKYIGGSHLYRSRNKVRELLLSNRSGRLKLAKDFGAVKIFHRIPSVSLDTLLYFSCDFNEIDTLNWNVPNQGIVISEDEQWNKIWHFTQNDTWGPSFSLNLDSLDRNKEFQIGVKLKIYGISEIPKALLITQVNDGSGILRWRRAEIYTQVDTVETWTQIYANHIIGHEQCSLQNLIFQAYLWNINKNDFYVGDFEAVVSKF